jgi:uncharacterized protein YecT (DUF1311 family)
MKFLTVTLAAATIVCGAAFAAQPSFDCQKAVSPTEKAICADDGLAVLDRAIAAAFPHYRKDLKSNLGDDIAKEQTAFLKARDICAAQVDCLKTIMQRRASALALTPDAGITDPRERFVGRYQNKTGQVIVRRNLAGGYELYGSAGDPGGRWSCDLDGAIGKVEKGVATVEGGEDKDSRPVYVELEAHGLQLTEDADHPLRGLSCGAEGSMDGDYRRVNALSNP